jgi:hypothetical protein
MPTAATAIDACSERQKQTAGSRDSKTASTEVGGRRQSDLRGWKASTRVELSFPYQGGLFSSYSADAAPNLYELYSRNRVRW